MKLQDLKYGHTWVVGVQGFASAMFIQYNKRYRRWQWTDNLLNANTFKNKDEANRCIINNAYVCKLLMDSMPKSEIGRVRAIKVELRVGT